MAKGPRTKLNGVFPGPLPLKWGKRWAGGKRVYAPLEGIPGEGRETQGRWERTQRVSGRHLPKNHGVEGASGFMAAN
ncbi:hypothetical protein BGS_0049 [Beggiatoa sp. SS]|nr:hypothetical protein BGS_0049 [Beggiatoa sp. SS]